MPKEKRIFRFPLTVLLFSLFAGGCGFLDKGESDYWIDTGTTPASGSTIDISGGAGTVERGGDGDQETGVWFDSYGPLGVKVYETGSADASFTLDLPAPTLDFGSEQLTVTADLAIPVYGSDPADNNVYYFRRDEPYLFHKIDDSTPIATVTGIRVNAGATLTLGINSDFNGNGMVETASLSLENDLEVLGTMRTAAFDDASTQESDYTKDRAGFALESAGGIFIRASGVVTTAGDNAATGRGGQGGGIVLVAYASEAPGSGIVVNQGLIDASGGSTADLNDEGGGSAAIAAYGDGLYLRADVRLVNTGTIRADGGNGGTGGHAGGPFGNRFNIASDGALQNAGPISVSGGRGSSGNGGNGGTLEMAAAESGTGAIQNSGAITTRGGHGTVDGGSGGNVNMTLNNVGDFLNSGSIDARGGDSTGTDDSVSTGGGQGGQIYVCTYGGRLISSGELEADGGNVANGNSGSYGGQGGSVDMESHPDYWSWTAPAGAMEVSGNILARGGSGPNGGYGGGVYLYYGDSSGTGGIVLRGYSNLVNNGGAGVTYGGGGGGFYLYDNYFSEEPGAVGLLTEADISANGGAATAIDGYGGYGGYVELWTSVPPSQYRGITVDGGAATTYPGDPGSIYIDGGGAPE